MPLKWGAPINIDAQGNLNREEPLMRPEVYDTVPANKQQGPFAGFNPPPPPSGPIYASKKPLESGKNT